MASPNEQGKASVSGGASRFPRFNFGSQLLQKTVGLVLRPRPGKQVVSSKCQFFGLHDFFIFNFLLRKNIVNVSHS